MARAAVVRLGLAVLVVAAAAGGIASTGHSNAAFTAQSANPANSFSTAATFCSGSTSTATASSDVYVDQAAPSGNYGTRTNLDVLSKKGANIRTLVAFGLPDRPDGCAVKAAALKLTATSAATGRTLHALRVDPAASWSESGVTWTTQPPTVGTAAAAPSVLGLVSWDVTAAVQAMYAEARLQGGFLVRDATEDSPGKTAQSFGSRESLVVPPTIEVTFG